VIDDEPRPGLLLHLTGPLQSWGERSRFNQRDTALFPTRSALIGVIAAACGYHRDWSPEDLRRLRFAVRTDRPGTLLRDFHTVGGGLPNRLTVPTAEGKPRPGDTATLVSTRYYIQDAAFTVAITAPGDPQLLERCHRALLDPIWPPYLGRRSCPPAGPLLLRRTDDAWSDLVDLPLHRAKPTRREYQGDRVPLRITFRADEPFDGPTVPPDCEIDGSQATSTVNDEPLSFRTLDRRYLGRTDYRICLLMPHERCAGLATEYLQAITAYLDRRPQGEPSQ
jgi:CRISPR system Cascade subunit CasD